MRFRVWAAPAGCALLGAAVFIPAVPSGRLADDFVLLRTVQRVSGFFWPFAHNDLGQPAGAGHFYRPVWVLWNAGIYQLSHSPVLVHVLNLILFGAVCGLVAALVAGLASARAGLLAGLAFAVFPSHGESVAWISGNTDLLAVALALGALLCAEWPGAFALTAVAMLVKEEAVVLPVLALLLGVRRRAVVAIVLAVVAVLIAHVFIVSGFGGYGPAFTVRRAGGSLASFGLGALSAPQLNLLGQPEWLLIPVALVTLLAAGIRRAPDRDRRLALAGLAWFVVALLPVLNEPLNLNTRNGDRLLLLPSVGLALCAGVLLARARNRVALAGAGVVAALCAASCVGNAFQWRTAGAESRRLLADIDRLAPSGAHLIVLSVPTDYRAAHLYPDSLDVAVQESGRPDVSLVSCAAVHALTLARGQVTFVAVRSGLWRGRATVHAPFDFPVLGGSVTASPGCSYVKPSGARSAGALGTSLSAIVSSPRPGIPIYFDGRDMVR